MCPSTKKLNKNTVKVTIKILFLQSLGAFESVASVKVTNWQIDSSQSFYDFLNNYEGRIPILLGRI